jgi:hypothetical protein
MGKLLEKEKQQVVGYSTVYLEGDSKICRLMECNLGEAVSKGFLFLNQNVQVSEQFRPK